MENKVVASFYSGRRGPPPDKNLLTNHQTCHFWVQRFSRDPKKRLECIQNLSFGGIVSPLPPRSYSLVANSKGPPISTF